MASVLAPEQTRAAPSAPWALEVEGSVVATAATRVVSIDVLRGLMALAVATYHMTVWTHALEGDALTAVVVLGIYSVQGFFVISGFCLYKAYGDIGLRWDEVKRFHVRRFWRIAPLYYAAIAASYLVGQPMDVLFRWSRLIENLTLSFGLFHPNHSWVLGGWSIGIEYVFYAVFPILAWSTRHSAAKLVLAAALIVWAVPCTFGAVEAAPVAEQFNVYATIGNHAFLFLLGALIADLHTKLRTRIPALLVIALVLGVGWLASVSQPEIQQHVEVMVGTARVKYVLACVVTVLLFAFASVRERGALRPLIPLGELSYSVYLVHPFAWMLTSRLLDEQVPASARMLAGLGVTLGLSALTYALIEKPAIGLARNLTQRA